MTKQKLTTGKPRNLSHNAYSVTSADGYTMLNRLSSLDRSDERRKSISDAINTALEFIALALLFSTFIVLISLSDGLDQQMIEWLGR